MVPALLTHGRAAPVPMLCVAGSSGRCRMLDQPHPILVKRYAETRLFDTTRAQYVTVQDLRNWQARGVSFMVVDAKTGAVVTQIILHKV